MTQVGSRIATRTRTLLLDDAERQRVFRICLDALARPGLLGALTHDLHPPIELPMLALTDLMTPIAALPGRRHRGDRADSATIRSTTASGVPLEHPFPLVGEFSGNDHDGKVAVTRIAGLTRAPLTTPDRARWVLAGPDPNPADVATLSTGTATDPHLGAMLCLAVSGLRPSNEPAPGTRRTGQPSGGDDERARPNPGAPTPSWGGPIAGQNDNDWRTLAVSGPGIPGTRLVQAAGLSSELIETRARLNSAYPRGIDILCIAPDGTLLGLPRTTRITEEAR